MDLRGDVFLGFSFPVPAASMKGRTFESDAVVATSGMTIGGAGDVTGAIEVAKRTEPVLAGVVGDANVANGSLDPVRAFSRSSDPLDVARGGTGASSFVPGALVISGNPFASSADCSAAGGVLRARSHVSVGPWRFAPAPTAHGFPTLLATDSSSGASVDLFNPSKPVAAPVVSLTPWAQGQATVEATGFDSYSRICHIVLLDASMPAPSRSRVVLEPTASVRIRPDGTVRHTFFGLAPGDLVAYAVAAGARRNYSDVASSILFVLS